MKDYEMENLQYHLRKQNTFWQKTIWQVIDWLESIGFEIKFKY